MASPQIERVLVRVLMAAALCVALLVSALAPVPPELPAMAFGQPGLYRLEIALLVFYGSLLLVTPAFAGLIRGRLPVEISTRGAKFAEEADQSAGLVKSTMEETERSVSVLAEKLNETMIEIDQMKKRGDST
jgi:hypothetical protein